MPSPPASGLTPFSNDIVLVHLAAANPGAPVAQRIEQWFPKPTGLSAMAPDAQRRAEIEKLSCANRVASGGVLGVTMGETGVVALSWR